MSDLAHHFGIDLAAHTVRHTATLAVLVERGVRGHTGLEGGQAAPIATRAVCTGRMHARAEDRFETGFSRRFHHVLQGRRPTVGEKLFKSCTPVKQPSDGVARRDIFEIPEEN